MKLMLRNVFTIFSILLLGQVSAQAQDQYRISLDGKAFVPLANIQTFNATAAEWKSSSFGNTVFACVQFQELPNAETRASFGAEGLVLETYLGSFAYLANIPTQISASQLNSWNVRAIFALDPAQKLSTELRKTMPPAYAESKAGFTDIIVHFSKNVGFEALEKKTLELNGEVIVGQTAELGIAKLRLPFANIIALSALPFVYRIEPLPSAQIVNYENRAGHGVSTLGNPLGRNLTGAGVTVGVGDDSDATTHLDYFNRLTNRNSAAVNNHGTHTTGTVGGAGLLNPKHRGMAPATSLISQYFGGILDNSGLYVQDYNMVVTNNSYYIGTAGCTGNGTYNSLAQFVDAQMGAYPNLLHCIAAGNDGTSTCAPFPLGYHTVKSGIAIAKNCLTVGAVNENGYAIAGFSSRGPCDDGRIKPEITAGGVNVFSTFPNNTYANNNGTSMATPTVAGLSALLYQRYRQLNSGADPKAALIKAAICNTAEDLGNPGPDYIYGFGWMNGRRAVKVLEDASYFQGTLAHGASVTHNISVPTGAREVRIMLYWNDAEGSPLSSTALVNDLDMKMTAPGGTQYLPWVLDPSSAQVTATATRGIDRLNNIEQITLLSPSSGLYQVNLNGFNIPTGAQEYVLVYEIVMTGIVVEYPNGSEIFSNGETERLRWWAYDGDSNTFNIEYSTDNGTSWNTINNSVASNLRTLDWVVPASVTDQALIRCTRNITGTSDVSDGTFSILAAPVMSAATLPCPTYASLSWTAVPGAVDYEVFQLQNGVNVSIGTTTAVTFTVGNLPTTSASWFAVSARFPGGKVGRRSASVSATPSTGNCTLAMFNNDLSLTGFATTLTNGRENTSTSLTNATPISIVVRNLDDAARSTAFTISYDINGGSVVSQSVTPTMAIRGSVTLTFTTTANLAAVGTYVIGATVTSATDPFLANNTASITIKQLANPVLTLPYNEGFEGTTSFTAKGTNIGLPNLDRIDFASSTARGQVRNVINSGFTHTGSKMMAIDAAPFNNTTTANSVTWTLNLTGFNAATQTVKMNAWIRHNGEENNTGDKIWVRGSDTDAWVQLYDLGALYVGGSFTAGSYFWLNSLNLSGALSAAGQNFSSSTQVRFGQEGKSAASTLQFINATIEDGLVLDDLKVYETSDDLTVSAIVEPAALNCDISSTTIKANIVNTSPNGFTNVPVAYRLNNGSTVTESIASIAAGATVTYNFTTTANPIYGTNTLDVWVTLPSDTYRDNDSIIGFAFENSPIIVAPHLESFESNNGYWFASGTNNTFDWGTPSSTNSLVKNAAEGNKCWKTKLNGNYSDNETSYLTSPCLDLTPLSVPRVSFAFMYHTETGWDYCWLEYSTNSGLTWTKVGTTASGGINWYNEAGNRWNNLISQQRWVVASHELPVGTNRIRFAFTSDGSVTFNGLAIDEIHFHESSVIYSGANTNISQAVSGSNWIHFDSGGNRLASINPNGQNLGSTSATSYFNIGAVRADNYTAQYYLDRNVVVKPSIAPSAPVNVRLYFTEAEFALYSAANTCVTCTKVNEPFKLGLTKWSGTASLENDQLSDNSGGMYQFLQANNVQIVPFQNGYFAEFQVSSFSEFWFNGGGANRNTPLPIELEYFEATKQAADALLTWKTASETNNDRFEIQVAANTLFPGEADFRTIGTQQGAGSSQSSKQYNFLDTEPNKKGIRYYRLVQHDFDGSTSTSPIRALNFGNSVGQLQITPNPSNENGQHLLTQELPEDGKVVIRIHDIHGKLTSTLYEGYQTSGTRNLNFSSNMLSAGVYFVSVTLNGAWIGTERLVVIK